MDLIEKYSLFYIIILSLIFITKSQNKQEIYFDGINKEILNFRNEIQIELIINELPLYTKLFINGEDDINYVLSAYSDENRENRIQLAQSYHKTTSLFLTNKQAISNKFYIDIECSSTPCIYNLTISPEEKIILEEGEQLYYYVNEENTNMEFEINLKSEKANIWSRGGRDIWNTLSNYYVSSKNKNNFIITNAKNKKIEFEVIGNVGDFINVGSNGYNEEKSSKNILVDEETMTVFLSKALFSKACFDFRTRDEISENLYVYMEGIIENSILKILINNENQSNDNNDKEILYNNGKITNYFFTKDLKNIEVCFTFPDEADYPQYKFIQEIIFNFRLTLGKNLKKGLYFNEPLVFGKLYPGNLRLGEITAYIGLEPQKDYTEINYNLFNKENSNLKMYVYDCDNYPLCLHKNNTIKNGINIRNIDTYSTYSVYKSELKREYNPISKSQKLFIIYCYNSDTYQCNYDSLIFTNIDSINVNENQYFNQYLLKDEKDNFKINFYGESMIKSVKIGITVFNGDIKILTDSFDGNKYDIQHYANKYFINIILGKNSEKSNEIIFSVVGKKNCYYTLITNFIRDNINFEEAEFLPGKSELITINPNKDEIKYINIKNTISSEVFMVNFYSLNCKYEIYKKVQKNNSEIFENIDEFNYYFEDNIFYFIDKRYKDDYFEYKIKVKEEDFSIYNNKLCMLYMSAIEQNKKYSSINQNLIIPDNTPQQIKFNLQKPHISYGYIHVDNKENLIIKFNLIYQAEYNVTIFIEYAEGKNYIVNSNGIIYLNHEEWENECPENNQICYIIIDITLNKTKEIENPLLELTIQSENSNTAVYFPKNILKIDYLNKISQQYFTELGKDEVGFIIVDFYRNNGKFKAKIIQKKYLDTNFDDNEINLLPYNALTKKIEFNTKNSKCEEGCFLLINIEANNENISNKDINIPFSIIVKSTLDSSKEIPPIRISNNDYIIGTIDSSNDNNIYEFYTIYINKETDNIIIDLQSECAELYIKIGDKKPSTLDFDYKILPEEKESIYTIKKDDILNKIGIQRNNIKNISLTIGVYNNKIDSIYSFIIYFESNLQNIIHRIKSEKKYLCDTNKFNENNIDYYNCLFVIENSFIGELNDLLIYPILKDKTANYQIYAEFINSSIFELGLETDIKIPTKQSEFSTYKTNLNYLYIKNWINNNNYLLINIVSNKNTRIELIPSFYKKSNIIMPNPLLQQIFFIKNTESIILDFSDNKNIMINLISILGAAQIFLEDDKNNMYYLNKEDAKLSLTFPKDKTNKLIIKNTYENNDNEIGFAFYLDYNTNKKDYNFNEIILGESFNFIYSDEDLPVNYYSKIKEINKDIEIFFTFYEMDNNNEIIYNDQIEGKVLILKEKDIYDIKSNFNIPIDYSKSIKFKYDPSLRTGLIRITKDQLKNYNINESDKPYLLVNIKKLNEGKIFKKLNIQITINQENSSNPLAENIYHNGILLEKETKKEYILKSLLRSNYLFFEFSSYNNDAIFDILDESGNKLEKISEKNKNGKYIYYFKISPEKINILKLIISKKKSIKNEINFAFKYNNIKEMNDYPEYIIEDDQIKVNIEQIDYKKNYKINLNPVKNSEKFNITYVTILGNNKKNKIPQQSIVIIEEENKIMKEYKNPSIKNNKLEFEFKNIENYQSYIHIVAIISDQSNHEFLSYKYFELPNQNKSKDNKFIIVLIISILLFIIIIGLIIALFRFRKKNKNLLDEVNKISPINDKEMLMIK